MMQEKIWAFTSVQELAEQLRKGMVAGGIGEELGGEARPGWGAPVLG